MTCAFDGQQFCSGGDHLERLFDLCNRSERIARAVHKQRRRVQTRQMLCALLLGTSRRMQRIGQQQQSRDEIRLLFRKFCAQHAGLASTVGVSTEKDLAFPPNENRVGWATLVVLKIPILSQRTRQGWGNQRFLYGGNCIPQPGTITSSIAGAGRSERSHLPIRQVAAQHGESARAESFGQRDQQRRLRIRSSTVRQNEPVAVGRFGRVHEAANRRIDGPVSKFADKIFRQAPF